MEKKWFVYIIECCDGSFYTGITNDLDKRMETHLKGKGSKYVARKGFRKLLRAKECSNKVDACKAEYFVKQLQKWDKLAWFRNSLNT